MCSQPLDDTLIYFVCLTFYHFCNILRGLKIYPNQSGEFCHAIANIPHNSHRPTKYSHRTAEREKMFLFIMKLNEDFRAFLPQKHPAFLVKLKLFLTPGFRLKRSELFHKLFYEL